MDDLISRQAAIDWYAKRDGVYYNFDMKRQRDDAVKNHNMVKVPAVEAAGLVEKMPDGKWHAKGGTT